VIALLDDDASQAGEPTLNPLLWFALSALCVRMPSLADRPADRLLIARAVLPTLAMRMGRPPADLDQDAAEMIARAGWPGNLRQMRATLSAALAEHRQSGPITGAEIGQAMDRSQSIVHQQTRDRGTPLLPLDTVFATTNFSMPELEREMYEAAVARADGNVSAAARLLGITRAQLAYRLGARPARRKAPADSR
jgi:DNA-binding NtrC family response regulator